VFGDDVRALRTGLQAHCVPMHRVVWAIIVLHFTAYAAHAEHATIALRVFRIDGATEQPVGEVTAVADAEPPAGGVKARPMFKARAGEPLVLQFIYTNTYPHGTAKGVRIRYFVARLDQAGQKETPDPSKGAVTQGEFHLTFKPKSKVGARAAFTVPAPGVYLLRVDSYNTHSDHEHFAAVELRVD
jgi:hypothetical protein